jgi:NADH dehydrogenase/NADH:ubiquinone oxidoreductase subunit G
MKAVIDGRPLEIDGQPTIVEAARSLGIEIPTLCYMPRLDPYAACRVCLVEVRGSKNPVTACATPLTDGMEIVTNSAAVRALRREVLDLILSEHPSACLLCAEKPTCDDSKSTIRKAGEPTGCVLCPADGRCELQRVVAEVGMTGLTHPLSFRGSEIRRDDPFIDRDDNLCILCGRCVRVCHEIRGADALAFIGRGNRMSIGTSVGKTLLEAGCQFCGACVDVCPTGALTERAVRYASRFDETRPFVCGLCGQGCRLGLRLLEGRPVEVRPENGPVNDGQACVKGRFAVRDLLTHSRRILRPLVRRGGVLIETSWEDALAAAGRGLVDHLGDLDALISAQDSCEDLWALGLLSRDVLQARTIELTEEGLRSPFGFPAGTGGRPMEAKQMERVQAFVVLEEPIFQTAPIFGLAMHRALRRGAKLVAIGDGDHCFDRCASLKFKAGPREAGLLLLDLLRKMRENDHGRTRSGVDGYESLRQTLGGISPHPVPEAWIEKIERLSKILDKRKPAVFIYGRRFTAGPWGVRNVATLWNLARWTNGFPVPIAGEANTRGALEIVNALNVSRASISAAGPTKGRALLMSGSRTGFVRREESFVVVLDAFLGDSAAQADVVLPRPTFLEQDGTFVNAEGRFQRSRAAVAPQAEARPVRQIASDLARVFGAKNFPSFPTSDDALAVLAAHVPAFAQPVRALSENRPAFLEANEGPKMGFVEIPDSTVVFGPNDPAEIRDPDDYLGLAMARDLKSLRTARRR